MSNFQVNESNLEEECDKCMEIINEEEKEEEEAQVPEEIEEESPKEDSSENGSEESSSSSDENSSEDEKLSEKSEKNDDENSFGVCEDNETVKKDKEGSNCPTTSFFQSIIDFLRKGL